MERFTVAALFFGSFAVFSSLCFFTTSTCSAFGSLAICSAAPKADLFLFYSCHQFRRTVNNNLLGAFHLARGNLHCGRGFGLANIFR